MIIYFYENFEMSIRMKFYWENLSLNGWVLFIKVISYKTFVLYQNLKKILKKKSYVLDFLMIRRRFKVTRVKTRRTFV